MCIVWNQSKKILRYGESCILDEVLFYLEEIESTMCHFPISKKIMVGEVKHVIFNYVQMECLGIIFKLKKVYYRILIV